MIELGNHVPNAQLSRDKQKKIVDQTKTRGAVGREGQREKHVSDKV
jgi:hypothetical protein